MLEIQSPYEALMLKAAQDEAFRQELIADPKATLKRHFGIQIPEDFTINLVENTATELTLVIPPLMTGGLSDGELEGVTGGKNDVRPELTFSLVTLGIGCMASIAVTHEVRKCRTTVQDFFG